MTVSYSSKVATAKFSCFFKLLIRWRGSIYKILWKEFIVFAVAYFTLSFVYRCALTATQKEYFEKLSEYCSQFSNLIPVAFVLGFYVNHVASRWWERFRTLPWPGRTAMFVTALLRGHDDRARLMRRTIMRYMCLSYVITMSSISPPVKKRFPTWKHMTEAGLMLLNEEKIMENLKTPYNKFFVPLIWASELVMRARTEGRIKDDFAVKTLIDEINDYRTRSFQLFNFDWINIPLVYTQVVTLAVYTFFLTCLMGRQYLDNGQLGDMYFPFFTFLQFVFYIGWLKVAETMLNPFGEDDDDFDINYLIDRHLKVSYLVVDEMHAEHPELIKDQYWDTLEFDLPYNAATEQYKQEPHLGSALNLNVPPEKSAYIPSSLHTVHEDFEVREVYVDATHGKSSHHPRHVHPHSSKPASSNFRHPTSNPRDIVTSGTKIHNSRNVGASLPCTTNYQYNPSEPRDIIGASVPCMGFQKPSTEMDYGVGSSGSTRRVARVHSSHDAVGSSMKSNSRAPVMSRLTSKSSISSQASERAGGFIKSLKRTFSRKNKQQSVDESDTEATHGFKMITKFHRTPSIASSCHSNDIPGQTSDYCGGHDHHDDLLFHMSESDSDESTTSLMDKPTAPKVKVIHFRSGRHPSKEDVRSHQHHVVTRTASDRRQDFSTSADHHSTKKSFKDSGRFKDEEFLSPIDEDPDGSVPDDKVDPFVSEVQQKLTELQESVKEVSYARQTSSPSTQMETLSLVGTSARSNVTH